MTVPGYAYCALGRFYSARNVLGFYRTTSALTETSFCTEGLSNPDSWFKNVFYRALYHTVEAHPSLCYGILDQTPDREAVFLRLQAIYRDDVAEFHDQDPGEQRANDVDSAITSLLERSHARILLEGHRKPSWRAVVFKHGNRWGSGSNSKIQKVSIAFLSHHALADGLSHVNFHRTLLQFFNDPETKDCVWPVTVPRDLRCPILLEDAVDLKLRDESDKSEVDYGATSVWSGANIFLPSIEEYASGLRIITIPQDEISKAVKISRSRRITLTGLIHGLIVTFLARYIPPGHNFLAVTPYSMRQITKVSDDEICNHASALVHDFSVPLVSEIRATPEKSLEELDKIVEVGHIFSKDMAAELARSPKNNVWAGMFGVSDWYSQSRAQLGKKRPLTYEISNLGNLKVVDPERDIKGTGLKLERMLVSQCGSVTGPVFCCNCVSIAGGPMTMTLTWQKGSMEERMIEDMARYLESRLMTGFDEVVFKE
ncbi:hypothetical protein ONS95_008951 [Cadophora gregata]|uniref:uncharacterized protein n=1 Tax=Cadophora gregata TaxID=51156 RepID=UPI0026DCB65B|nr:uncharacterized protein ONS95_008951 [Cadophora gregata]KAK0123963.1 hypothetical protein ONS95_008951 [Cadophora gregata]